MISKISDIIREEPKYRRIQRFAKESTQWLKDQGLVHNPVLGWVKPEEIEESRVVFQDGEWRVPTEWYVQEKTDKALGRKAGEKYLGVARKFLDYQARKQREHAQREAARRYEEEALKSLMEQEGS